MERLLTIEEKIRRAEDIYRRKNTGVRVPTNTISNRRDFRLLRKIYIQMLICIIIYCGFYILKENKNIFSEDVRNRVREILSYDINFGNIYNEINKYFSNIPYEENVGDTETEADVNENTEITIDGITEEAATDEQPEEDNLIEDILSISEIVLMEETSSISESKTDAEYIKNNFSIKSPLKGTITSRFGVRTPTTPTVPKYHTGIDIAVNKGTKFVAAMEGTVTFISNIGDFGNHFIITNDNVSTLYAHCDKMYIKKGDKIKQGQEIGTVGSTGNATGPHLHFEIQIDGRLVNPEDVAEFD